MLVPGAEIAATGQQRAMRQQPKYVVQVWDKIGVPCDQRWLGKKAEAIGIAKSTAQANSFATTVYYEGAVIARFDHRPRDYR